MALDRADFYDAELARHNRHLRIAAGVGADDRVLDIGCGAGQTTREAARAAAQGEAVGVDVSAEMLEVARRRSAAEGLRNVAFEQADAQSHIFPPTSFDLCISRFGVMFFVDPAAAFANIGGALRPGGRLVWMVWQSRERNAWSGDIRQALGTETAVSAGAPDPYSLGDPSVATDLLNTAGFTSIDFIEVREPVFYGPDADAASNALAGLYIVTDPLTRTNKQPGRPLQRLRDLMEAHMTPEGVLFDSQAWIITARRALG